MALPNEALERAPQLPIRDGNVTFLPGVSPQESQSEIIYEIFPSPDTHEPIVLGDKPSDHSFEDWLNQRELFTSEPRETRPESSGMRSKAKITIDLLNMEAGIPPIGDIGESFPWTN